MKTIRAEYGALKSLTPEEYAKHKAIISKRWRENNREKSRAYAKQWYRYRKQHGHHTLVCKCCGKTFNSYRITAKICQNCIKRRKK